MRTFGDNDHSVYLLDSEADIGRLEPRQQVRVHELAIVYPVVEVISLHRRGALGHV